MITFNNIWDLTNTKLVRNKIHLSYLRLMLPLAPQVTDISHPGGGLGIFTNRDKQSILLAFEFGKSVIFWLLVIDSVFFGVVK